jgi:hypothetical protein
MQLNAHETQNTQYNNADNFGVAATCRPQPGTCSSMPPIVTSSCSITTNLFFWHWRDLDNILKQYVTVQPWPVGFNFVYGSWRVFCHQKYSSTGGLAGPYQCWEHTQTSLDGCRMYAGTLYC